MDNALGNVVLTFRKSKLEELCDKHKILYDEDVETNYEVIERYCLRCNHLIGDYSICDGEYCPNCLFSLSERFTSFQVKNDKIYNDDVVTSRCQLIKRDNGSKDCELNFIRTDSKYKIKLYVKLMMKKEEIVLSKCWGVYGLLSDTGLNSITDVGFCKLYNLPTTNTACAILDTMLFGTTFIYCENNKIHYYRIGYTLANKLIQTSVNVGSSICVV